jgi:3-methyladenine DNA glycosylase/8-oxoguanine DNA glycosylase
LKLVSDRAVVVTASAWGPGADWVVGGVPDLLGFADDPSDFPAEELPEPLRESWRRLSGRWRVPASRRVLEALIAAVFEQKVTGIESRRSWRGLLTGTGEAAPGPTPTGMRVLPEPRAIAAVPSWQWHRWGSRPQQAATIMRALGVAGRLEQCIDLRPDDARRRLMSIDGIGEWTAAEVGARALGDADAVSFGDFHLAGQLVYAFTGRRDGTDAQMAVLLEPFAGHRHRVQRLVELSGISKPARGPRASITDHRRR